MWLSYKGFPLCKAVHLIWLLLRLFCYPNYLNSLKSIIRLSTLYLDMLFHYKVQEPIQTEQKANFWINYILHTCLINSEHFKCLKLKVCDDYAKMQRINWVFNHLLLIWTCGFSFHYHCFSEDIHDLWEQTLFVFNLKSVLELVYQLQKKCSSLQKKENQNDVQLFP